MNNTNAHIWEHEWSSFERKWCLVLNFLVIHFKNEDDMILYKWNFNEENNAQQSSVLDIMF